MAKYFNLGLNASIKFPFKLLCFRSTSFIDTPSYEHSKGKNEVLTLMLERRVQGTAANCSSNQIGEHLSTSNLCLYSVLYAG